jgi:hypothetical protein
VRSFRSGEVATPSLSLRRPTSHGFSAAHMGGAGVVQRPVARPELRRGHSRAPVDCARPVHRAGMQHARHVAERWVRALFPSCARSSLNWGCAGTLPYLTHGHRAVPGLSAIVKYVAGSGLGANADLDGHLSKSEKARNTAWAAHVESQLGALVVCCMHGNHISPANTSARHTNSLCSQRTGGT